MSTRRTLRLFGGAIFAISGTVLAVMACGPGDLHYLMAGDPASTEPPPDDPADPCKHARPPAKPEKQNDQKTVNVTFATDDMRLDTGPDPKSGLSKPQSLDLDNTCSCGPSDAGPSCVQAVVPGVEVPSFCDGDKGRDNATADLLQVALAALPAVFGPDSIRDRIHKGFYAVLIGVNAWNGTMNDDKVGVSVLMSPGIDGPKDDLANLIPPKFDGTDKWKIETGSITAGATAVDHDCEGAGAIPCDPIAFDFDGYVSNGTLVAKFEKVPFAFGDPSARISIPFQNAKLVAKITGTEPNFKLDGELVGRWPATAIINAVGSVAFKDDEGGVQSLCQQAIPFEFFRARLCSAVDLAPTEADDNKGKPCTALSQSVRFTAVVAHQGIVASSATSTGSDLCPKNLNLSCKY